MTKPRRLPDALIERRQLDDQHLLIGAHEYLGSLYWTKFPLADVPEKLIDSESVISFILHVIDLRALYQDKPPFDYGRQPIGIVI